MVSVSDFLSASPFAETWHVLLGVAVILIGVVILRLSPIWGTVIIVGFVAFAAFKEFYLDPVLEGASINSGWVDVTFFYIGGIIGGVGGFLPPKYAVLVVSGSLIAVLGLLFAGVV